MAYRKIDPRLWDDERFVELTAIEKLLWLYILTGPHTTSLPGLWIVGIGELVDGMRLEERFLRPALGRLEGDGMLTYNPRVRLMRVPNAPRYNRPDNARVLRSWFRLWSDTPECQQKYDHLLSLRTSIAASPDDASEEQPAQGQAIVAQWKATFEAVCIPEKFANLSHDPHGARHAYGANGSRTFLEPLAKGSPALVTASVSSLDLGSDLDPLSSQKPTTVLDNARAHTVGRVSETDAILAKLQSLPGCAKLATVRQAGVFASRVVQGGIPLAAALQALTDGAFKSASECEAGRTRTPQELAAYLMGCIGRASRDRGPAAPAAVQRGGWSRDDATRSQPELPTGDEV